MSTMLHLLFLGLSFNLVLVLGGLFDNDKYPIEDGRHVIDNGERQFGDELLYFDQPSEKGEMLKHVGNEYCFPPKGSNDKVKITEYEVMDKDEGDKGGVAFDVSGGVGQGQVCVFIKTKYGGSYHYKINVYGYRQGSPGYNAMGSGFGNVPTHHGMGSSNFGNIPVNGGLGMNSNGYGNNGYGNNGYGNNGYGNNGYGNNGYGNNGRMGSNINIPISDASYGGTNSYGGNYGGSTRNNAGGYGKTGYGEENYGKRNSGSYSNGNSSPGYGSSSQYNQGSRDQGINHYSPGNEPRY